MKLTGINGAAYSLSPAPIGSGGEGEVYRVHGMGAKVAKIYKSAEHGTALEDKLRYMVANPPNVSVLSQVAWPLDVLYDSAGKCKGFVMPELSINDELGQIYKYPSTLSLSAQQKINIAQNICVVISEVHKAGYVFGDFNPRNIGLDKNTGMVSFLDTDTYHVIDRAKDKVYRCNVCAPGYAAPELLTRCSDYVAENPEASKNAYALTPLPTFTQETDNFALAIHIFKLLMNGYTPFGGIIESASVSQSSPGVGDNAVRRDSYCFKPGFKHQSAAILPLDALPEEIADLFTRAFIVGKHEPKQRPDAATWHGALGRFEKVMVTCPDNPLHQYDKKNTDCPLCEADRRFEEAISGFGSGKNVFAQQQSKDSLSQSGYSTPVPVAGRQAGKAVSSAPLMQPTQYAPHVTAAHTTPVTPPKSDSTTVFAAPGKRMLWVSGVANVILGISFVYFFMVDLFFWYEMTFFEWERLTEDHLIFILARADIGHAVIFGAMATLFHLSWGETGLFYFIFYWILLLFVSALFIYVGISSIRSRKATRNYRIRITIGYFTMLFSIVFLGIFVYLFFGQGIWINPLFAFPYGIIMLAAQLLFIFGTLKNKRAYEQQQANDINPQS